MVGHIVAATTRSDHNKTAGLRWNEFKKIFGRVPRKLKSLFDEI